MRGDADKELAEAFRALKSVDAESTPEFAAPTGERRVWKPRLGAPATAVAAVAAVLCLLAVFRNGSNGVPDDPSGAIAFEQLSEVISREVFAASAVHWESPTSFLLNPDLETSSSSQQ